MKKTYKIEVDCANCANLMEEAARKTVGVSAATVNFMTQKMIVEFAEGQQESGARLRDLPVIAYASAPKAQAFGRFSSQTSTR